MKKGFTLIELLIAIAIIAILGVVVVIIINPAALLQEGRDATRISDMSTLNKAIALYYQDAMNNPSTLFMGTSSVMYVSIPDPAATSTAGDQCQGLGLPTLPTGYTYHCAASSTYMKVDGTGWIPINFTSYVAGSILSKLPVDPVNTTSTDLYYTYTTDGIGGFKVATFFESQKDAPLMASDGGDDPLLYEKGSNLALASGRGLVGYWPLNEGNGSSTIDWSGGGDQGTWTGTPVGTSGYYSPGKVETWAGTFDGVSNYVSCGNNIPNFQFTSAQSFTDAAWFYVSTSTGSIKRIFSYSRNSGGWHGLIVAGSYPEFDEGGNYIYDPVPSLNQWHFIVGVQTGNVGMSLYVDGKLTASANTPGNANGAGSCEIGDDGVGEIFAGLINDVRVYSRALSATEIQEMYNAEK